MLAVLAVNPRRADSLNATGLNPFPFPDRDTCELCPVVCRSIIDNTSPRRPRRGYAYGFIAPAGLSKSNDPKRFEVPSRHSPHKHCVRPPARLMVGSVQRTRSDSRKLAARTRLCALHSPHGSSILI
eukprot:7171796-Prymnesium_polylepis.2